MAAGCVGLQQQFHPVPVARCGQRQPAVRAHRNVVLHREVPQVAKKASTLSRSSTSMLVTAILSMRLLLLFRPPTLRCPTAICPCYHPHHAARRSFPSSGLFPPCPSNRTVAYFGEHRLRTIVRSPFSRPSPANPWKTWPCNGVNFDGSGCTVLPDVPSDEASDGVNFRVAFGNRA